MLYLRNLTCLNCHCNTQELLTDVDIGIWAFVTPRQLNIQFYDQRFRQAGSASHHRQTSYGATSTSKHFHLSYDLGAATDVNVDMSFRVGQIRNMQVTLSVF
jgi:hypothetical protein